MARNKLQRTSRLNLSAAVRALATVALFCIGLAHSAFAADKRVALVIGNSDYRNVSQLPNPSRDADAIGALLKKAGFDVVDARTNLNGSDMRRLIRDFSDKVASADIAVVFYAGHGIEVDGNNYLLPVDTRLERDIDVEDEAVSLDRVVRIIEPAKKLRLVILDACRDNPFAKTMKRSLSTRSVERGLGKVEPTSPNTLIAYAAKAGSTAADGDGANSPFTTALLTQLAVPGQDVRRSFGFVRDAVLKATNNKQEPFVYGSLGGEDVTLVPAAAKPANVPAQVSALDPNSQLRRDYELAAQVNTKQGWDAFIAAHPTGFYADLAKAARSKIDTGTKTAAATPETRAPTPNTNPYSGLENYLGRSFQLTFFELVQEQEPVPGLHRWKREFAAFLKSADDVSTRLTYVQPDPTKNTFRWAQGALGDFNRGIQWTYADNKLTQTILTNSYRIKITISANGNICQAQMAYERFPNKDFYELRKSTGETLKASSVTADNIACRSVRDNVVGQVPVAQTKQ